MTKQQHLAINKARMELMTYGYITKGTKVWLKNLGLDPVDIQAVLETKIATEEHVRDEGMFGGSFE